MCASLGVQAHVWVCERESEREEREREREIDRERERKGRVPDLFLHSNDLSNINFLPPTKQNLLRRAFARIKITGEKNQG